jgi:formiminotetrahydrofolate cyclodeaminase
MSDFGIETPEERRARYVRLARAASEAAAKSPLPGAKEMYVKLAQAWVAMADENDRAPAVSYDETTAQTGDSVPVHGGLNVKLNGMP